MTDLCKDEKRNNDNKKQLTAMTGETDDQLLSTYLELAQNIVIQHAFPFGNYADENLTMYNDVLLEIAAYMLNKRGAEGETAHMENGINRYYEDGSIPPSILRRIVPHAGVL